MSDTEKILDKIREFIAHEIDLLESVNPNLTGTDITITITPDAASGYRSTENSTTFYVHGHPYRKVLPLHCPACREPADILVYSFYNVVPVCETCNKA